MEQEDLSKYNPEGSTLRKAQLRMLDMLIEIDKICRKHNIPYWIDYGTLLGAVRHRGFIPWDDDLDIAVMRDDFHRLKKILKRELPDNMVYQDSTNEWNLPLLFGKVRDVNSYFEEEYTYKLKYKGIFVDIFPMEKVPSMKWKTKLDYWYGHCFRAIHNFTDRKDKLKSICAMPFAWFMLQATRLCNRFSPSRQIAHVYGLGAYNCFSMDDVFPVKRMSFEDIEVCVPNNPDAVLTALYGDYMQIPPEEKRITHTGKIEFYDE